jgi:hypothetical protein
MAECSFLATLGELELRYDLHCECMADVLSTSFNSNRTIRTRVVLFASVGPNI